MVLDCMLSNTIISLRGHKTESKPSVEASHGCDARANNVCTLLSTNQVQGLRSKRPVVTDFVPFGSGGFALRLVQYPDAHLPPKSCRPGKSSTRLAGSVAAANLLRTENDTINNWLIDKDKLLQQYAAECPA